MKNSAGKIFGGFVRISRRGDGLLRQESAVHIGDRDGAQRRSHIGDDNRPPIVETQVRGPPSPRQSAGRPIDHPALADELFGNQRNRAALQP